MEVELKKVKIGRGIINQCLPASHFQITNGHVLGYVVIGSDKKTKVLIYDGINNQLVLGTHYKKIELIKDREQIDHHGTYGEVFKIEINTFSGGYSRTKSDTNENTEKYYNELKEYKRKVDAVGQIYY